MQWSKGSAANGPVERGAYRSTRPPSLLYTTSDCDTVVVLSNCHRLGLGKIWFVSRQAPATDNTLLNRSITNNSHNRTDVNKRFQQSCNYWNINILIKNYQTFI